MKRAAQPSLSVEGQQALDLYTYALKQEEALSSVTIRNYLGDLRQFITWCESVCSEKQDEPPFTPQTIVPSLLMSYRTYLQTTLWIKPSSINRTLMSLKRYFAWALREQLIQDDPIRSVKFVPKEATTPRHLSDEEDALVAAVKHVGKLSGTLRVIGRRKKVRGISLNVTVRTILLRYLETLLQGTTYLSPSKKTRDALTEKALGHLIAKYAQSAQVLDVSPQDLLHHFGSLMAAVVPLHQLAQMMGHDSLDTTMLYIRGTKQDLQLCVEKLHIITNKD